MEEREEKKNVAQSPSAVPRLGWKSEKKRFTANNDAER
jgi:hypothetical protein